MRLLWLVLFVSSFGLKDTPVEEERIPWRKNFALTWQHFKGKPDYSSPYAAVTSAGISISFSGNIKKETVTYKSKVVSYFYPNRSWYKEELISDDLLEHEQLHFDIAELHARKLRKAIADFSFTVAIEEEMDSLYKVCNHKMKRVQHQYDEETNFSQRSERQKVWRTRVKKELEALDSYEN